MKTLNRVSESAWIDRELAELTRGAARTIRPFHDLVDELATLDRDSTMSAFVDELHRRFVYAPDPTMEERPFIPPLEKGLLIDADDACLFVAALAKIARIPCRFVCARYNERCWTCFLTYQTAEGQWVGLNPLRQKTTRSLDELVIGPLV